MASNKRRVEYQIGFRADTTQLQADLQKALDSLNKLGTSPSLQITTQLREASKAALELSTHLNTAYNKETGKLDLTSFRNSLNKSGMELSQYATRLSAIGPEGEKAFLSVASAIAKAELPLKRSNQLLNSLWVTMKNTVRWQVTSSVLHGLVGSLETAYGYSKDLDKSLNSIRIVTEKSADEMRRFAKEANNAAKELSTTTTKYTDASLIYYQQGLNDQEVKGRTDTTVQMANVSGQTAETASEQLTAIWNNFYNGSKSLQYYADVMVALGASTASSSDEIAEGIQKFAAVAGTVGLSYEYAASALATLTANTRESADVVGNALKTLFARIQGLKLGETLDDGTDMNKYSKALMAVGVNIKDVSGELKSMDQILDETAAKWATLNKDQQTALAQTVAGVRQYNQFVALMNSWGDFQKNLTTAYQSEGALTQQAEIYAESWKAARDRVRASAEDIYDSLINPDFYIGVDNVLTPFLSRIADVIDSLGGMEGVLGGVFLLVNKVYGDKIAQSMRDMATNVGIISGKEAQRARELQAQTVSLIENMRISFAASESDAVRLGILKEEVQIQGKVNEIYDQLTVDQRRAIENEQFQLDLIKQQNLELATKMDKYQEKVANAQVEIVASSDGQDWRTKLQQEIQQWNAKSKASYQIQLNIRANSNINTIRQQIMDQMDQLIQKQTELKNVYSQFTKLDKGNAKTYLQNMRELYATFTGFNTSNMSQSYLEGQFKSLNTQATNTIGKIQELKNLLELSGVDPSVLKNYVSDLINLSSATNGSKEAMDLLKKKIEEYEATIKRLTGESADWAQTLVNVGSSISALSMGLNSINSIVNQFDIDNQASGVQRFTQVLSSLTGVFFLVNSLVKAFQASLAAAEATTITFGVVVQRALGPLMLIVTVVSAVTMAIAQMKKNQEKASKAIIDAYNSELEALNEINNALETKKKRLEELLEIDAPTLTDKEEIANLKEEIFLLEQKQKIQEKILNDQQIESAREIANTWQQNYKQIDQEEYQRSLKKHPRDAWKDLEQYGFLKGDNNAVSADEWRDTALYHLSTKGLTGEQYNIEFNKIQTRYEEWTNKNKEITQQFLRDTQEQRNLLEEQYNQYVEAYLANPDQLNKQVVDSMQNALYAMRKLAAGGKSQYLDIYVKPILDESSEQLFTEYAKEGTVTVSEELQKLLLKSGVSLNQFTRFIKDSFDEAKKNLSNFMSDIDVEKFLSMLSEQDFRILATIDFKNISSLNDFYKKFLELKRGAKVNIEIDIKNAMSSARDALKILAEGDDFLDEATIQSLKDIFDGFYDLSNLDNLSMLDQAKAIGDALTSLTDIDALTSKTEEQLKAFEQLYTETSNRIIASRNEIDSISKNLVGKWDEEGNDWVGSEEELKSYEKGLKRIKKLQDDIFKDQIVETQLELNIEDATTKLDQLNEFELDPIEIQISKVDAVLGQMGAIKKAASLIGEGFKVAAKDVEDLMKVAPELFEDATVKMETGVVQLSKEVVNKVAENNQEMVNNKVQALQAELQATATKTQFEIDLLNQLKAVEEGNASEVLLFEQGTEEQKKQNKIIAAQAMVQARIQQAIQEKTTGDQSALDAIHNQNEVSKASAKQGQITAGNWANAASKIDQAMHDAFYNAYQYGQALANGQAISEAAKGVAYDFIGYTTSKSTWSENTDRAGEDYKYLQDFMNNGFQTDASHTDDEQTYELKKAAEGLQKLGYNLTDTDLSNMGQSGFLEYMTTGKYTDRLGNTYDKGVDSEGESVHAKDINGALSDSYYEIAQVVDLLSKIGAANGAGKLLKDSGKGKGSLDKDLKDLKDVEDRYHEINRQIERQNDLLEDVGNEIDRSYGTDKLDNYKKELDLLTGQQENYNKKLQEARDNMAENYLDKDTGTLAKLFGDKVQYDDKGELANYNELLKETVESYNAMVTAATTKEQVEAAKKLYKDKIDALKMYESTLDEIRDIEDKLQELERDIQDNKLSQIEYRLEIVLDAKSMYDSLRDFDKKVQETFNDALTYGLPVAKIGEEQTRAEMNMLPEYQQQYNDLVAMYEQADTDADRSRIMKDIQDLQSKVLGSAEAIIEWVNSIEDIVPAAVEAAAERYAKFTDQLEHNTTVLDTIKELYTLQGVTYKTMDGFNKLQKVSQERLDAQLANSELERRRFEEAQKLLAESQAALDSLNGNENDIRYDTYLKARDAHLAQFNEAQEAYLSLAKEAMETAQQMYLDQIEKAVYEFGQVVSNGIGLDLLQDRYDHFIEKDDRYFDKVNEAYQTASWYNKLQADIDKVTNNKFKDQLKNLQEEIDLRREGGKLSQYDLDILEAKYKVLQAQMALEDAQNAKNKLQLVRDRQGNWNYQYTADPSAVEDAQQDLLDAENEWYNIAKQQVEDVTGEIISTWQECQDKIKEIYSDMTLTDEERALRAQEIYSYYTEKIKYLEEEKNVAISDMTEAADQALKDTAEATGADLTNIAGATAESIIKELDSMTQGADKFEQNLQNTLDKANDDFNKYQDNVANVADKTGTSLDKLDDQTNKVSDSTDRLRDAGIDASYALADMVNEAQNAAWTYADMATEVWGTVEALRALAAAQASYNASKVGVSDATGSNKNYDPNLDYTALINYGLTTGKFQYGDKTYNELFQQREDKIDGEKLQEDYYGTRGEGAHDYFKDKSPGDTLTGWSAGRYTDESYEETLKKLGIAKYATGGYTGDFDDGKLAFLHEKELVLNQEDTKNILAAVDAVRSMNDNLFASIEKELDNGAMASLFLMAQKLKSTTVDGVNGQLEQRVIIEEVSFPNATDRNEIEEAFRNLTNDAAQYARLRRD